MNNKILYAIITKQCNLSCPHCDIKSNQKDNYQEEIFLKNLKEWDGYRILFGGEPTIVPARTIKVISYCDSISTNLVSISDDIKQILQERQIPIATSWNLQRFTHPQYIQWIYHLKELSKTNDLTCLITLTPDLFSQTGTNSFWQTISDVKSYFSYIQFEPLHDESKTQEFYNQTDEWLVQAYQTARKKSLTYLFPQFQKDYQWKFNCAGTYTMHPDGSIRYGCPEYQKTYILPQCYSCQCVTECQPCRLQKCCTRPNKLYSLIRD